MKVRIAKDLYADIQARAALLGCDVSVVARRALRMASRCDVANLLPPEHATREGSTVATIYTWPEDWPRDGTGTARIRWALDATRQAACCATEPETEPGPVEPCSNATGGHKWRWNPWLQRDYCEWCGKTREEARHGIANEKGLTDGRRDET